jgi:hypothetical protein
MSHTVFRRLAAAAAVAAAPLSALATTIVTSPFRGVTHYLRTEEPGVVAPRLVVMNIVKIELADPGVSFFTTPGNGSAPGELTGQRTSQFVAQHNLQIGINADFFSSAGTGPNGEIYRDVTNLAASNGSLVSPWPASPGTIRGALNVSANKVPTLVRPASDSGGTYNTTPAVTPYNAVGGSDRMIDNGNIVLSSAFANEVHPRTVIGYNATHLFLFTVDGRQAGYSEGMNLHEIANVLKNDYGVTYALNLDGGGSTTMVMADPTLRVVNRPSDPGNTERVNGNNFGVFAAQWPQWAIDSNGSWSVAANWIGGVPNGVGHVANLRNAISANRTITMNTPVTLGTLNFESTKGYTLSGVSLLTLDANAGNAAINITTPVNHAIVTPLKLNDATTDITIATGGSLAIAETLNNSLGRTITKSGGGAVNLSGPQTHGAGAVLNVNAGTFSLGSNAGGSATGSLTINANGGTTRFLVTQNLNALNVGTAGVATIPAGPGKTLKTKSLTVAGVGKFDVTDNNVVIDYTGSSPIGVATAGDYNGITGAVQTGRAQGAWNGPGINSSRTAIAGGLTAIAVAEAGAVLGLSAGQTATWSGHTVDATSLLLMYTYDGDANLDGLLSGDDYTAIDFNVAIPAASGYTRGDFNLDGIISGDDYAIIDFNMVAQGAPIVTGGAAASLAAVPEPSLLIPGFLALAGLAGRRRRVSRSSAARTACGIRN